MRNLTPSTEEKLGFTELRKLLESRATTEEGKAQCLRMMPFRQARLIEPELERVRQCRDMMLYEDSFALEFTGSMSDLLSEISIEGHWLKAADLFRVAKWLRMVRELLNYFKQRKEKYPGMWELMEDLEWNKGLLEGIDRILDERGSIRDNASPKLQQVRKSINEGSVDLRRMLQATLRSAIANGWSDGAEVTIRNERFVIPMKADFKGKIKGFVHDISQSGQTIYVEPTGALELNNALRELQILEQNEIVRLLTEATNQLRLNAPQLLRYAKTVTKIDFTRAKARLAIDMKAEKPIFKPEEKRYSLIKGRHPLLLAKHGFRQSEVVPLSFTLDPNQRILLISGPNAGGKSVTLKTVGLLQLMVQSGLLAPVGEASEFRYFSRIFLDIGDEQSIQSDLSTYTSHLRNMREMLGGLDGDSLFLMDEFGSGTDPRLGGAMAEAFLVKFVESGAYGVVTTHYGNLKRFAENSPGIQNAAMQFDPSTLTPTYQIEVGVPGRSYAFEIARNVGVPEYILEDASSRIEGGEIHTEELLLKLEAQRAELEAVLRDNKAKNEELRHLLERNRGRIDQLKVEEGKVLAEAHRKAQALIDSANAKIERTIKEIRENQADKEKTRELRKELAEMLPEQESALQIALDPEEVEMEEAEKEDAPELLHGAKIEVGDWVQIQDSASYGQVIDLQANRAVVALGDMRVTVKAKGLVKIKPPKPGKTYAASLSAFRLGRKATASTELRIQGFRVEQALPVVQRFLDDAILANIKEVRILHGKGTGALREAIRELLAAVPEVKSMEDAHPDQGGEGWTVVRLH